MSKLVYTHEEILADHPFAKPHEEAGYRLHGGFDANGNYISPRTLHRWPAIRAWSEALTAQGHDLVDASQQLMSRGSFPNIAQQSFLLDQGFGQTLWDSLSVTGVIEARGRMLADAEAPDFQNIVEGDISQTATAHLNEGLLRAHGLDEGGDGTLGGHDAMWFAVRDMLFGRHAYPHAEVPESLSRPEAGRLMPQVPWTRRSVVMRRARPLRLICLDFCAGPSSPRRRSPGSKPIARSRARTSTAAMMS